MAINIFETIDLLNFYLAKKSQKRSFVICGGASLILQGLTREGRVTKDIDILAPEIDAALSEASIKVADDLGISPKWLNTDAKDLLKDLESGWENRVFQIYVASNLEVFSISREDMIFAKFWAYCDRQQDINDLIDLKVSLAEIEKATALTKSKDANPVWPDYVDEQSEKLKRRMGYVS